MVCRYGVISGCRVGMDGEVGNVNVDFLLYWQVSRNILL